MTYNRYATEGQSIVDITVQEYNDIRLLPLLLFDNELEPDASLAAGDSLAFQVEVPALYLQPATASDDLEVEESRPYTKLIEDGQDLFDMAIQEYGSIELLPVVLVDNGLSPEAYLSAGNSLTLRQLVPMDITFDAEALNFFRSNELRVNCRRNAKTGGWWGLIGGGWWGLIDGGYWELLPDE